MYGSHYLKGWSKTQATRALSLTQAQLYSTVKTASETIGIVSIFQDFNMIVKGRVLCDASAALGIVRRKGVGKTRHRDTGLLWIQQKNELKELRFDKVLGQANPADMYTKVLASDAIRSTCAPWVSSTPTGKTTLRSRSTSWLQRRQTKLKDCGRVRDHNLVVRTRRHSGGLIATVKKNNERVSSCEAHGEEV